MSESPRGELLQGMSINYTTLVNLHYFISITISKYDTKCDRNTIVYSPDNIGSIQEIFRCKDRLVFRTVVEEKLIYVKMMMR